jgi:ABC-type nitrate/sulfonate/bicarbonate transport system ATPase subunit
MNFSGLDKSYFTAEKGRVRALRECSLEIERGAFTVIVGRSGCGKTTLLKCIGGLETPDSGALDFDGGIRRGFMFQDPRLLPWLTVKENLRLAFPPQKKSRERSGDFERRIRELLGLVGLAGWERAYPRQLSGGMAQRASLARCLCRKPELLLLDEPLSALDAFTRKRLREELGRLWANLGLTIILVTHDIEEAVYLGDTVYLMEEGCMTGRFPVGSAPLRARPRDYRSAAFQDCCRRIEDALNRETHV